VPDDEDRDHEVRGDPLTTTISAFLALVAGGATLAGLVFVVWWLARYWAP
jgi:hypothetical protein